MMNSSLEEQDRHAPLSRDIQLLGELLGDVLCEQEGEELYQLVEQVRALSRLARGGDREARESGFDSAFC